MHHELRTRFWFHRSPQDPDECKENRSGHLWKRESQMQSIVPFLSKLYPKNYFEPNDIFKTVLCLWVWMFSGDDIKTKRLRNTVSLKKIKSGKTVSHSKLVHKRQPHSLRGFWIKRQQRISVFVSRFSFQTAAGLGWRLWRGTGSCPFSTCIEFKQLYGKFIAALKILQSVIKLSIKGNSLK